MSKTIEEIFEILGFDHVTPQSVFNLKEVKKVAELYSQSQTQGLQEQNAELVEMIEKFKEEIIKAYDQGKQDFARYDPERHGNEFPDGDSYYRTKYNHLKSNTNETDKI